LKGDGEYSVPYNLYYLLSQIDDWTALALFATLVVAVIHYLVNRFTSFKIPGQAWYFYFALLLVVFGAAIGERTVGCSLQLGQEYPGNYR
jgi:MFS superfamily sulfate permease-like transporter